MTTVWSAHAVAAIADTPIRTSPLIDPAAGKPILPGFDLWDYWPVQERNGSTAQLDFPTIHLNEYRVLADPRSPGFATMPRVELLTAPIVVLAAFNGNPPYTLKLGNAAAESAYFKRRELLGRPRSDAALPENLIE